MDPGLFQVVIEDVLADNGFGLAVGDLVFDLDAGIDRTDRCHLGAQPEGGEIGDHILGAVQKIQGHGIPFFHPQIGQARS